MNYKAVSGTQDILPKESHKWQHIEDRIRQFMSNFQYKEVRTPIFEYSELFSRGIGEGTDIVSKEMYTFPDSGNKMLTLRPENTASVVRMNIQYNLPREFPQNKLYYIGAMFRRERPQKGRYRQFHQFGIEAIGPKSPELDLEVMLLAIRFYESFQLKNIRLLINSVGDAESRDRYREKLKDYVAPNLERYCDDCKKRYETNPLRILDCKKDVELNRDAPSIIDSLNTESKAYFDRICALLDYNEIEYKIDHSLVRGLDYYSDIVFEISSSDLGSQSALCGGGRYDALFEEFGAKRTPSVGFAGGMERLLLALEARNYQFPIKRVDLFVATLDSDSRLKATKLIDEIRLENISLETDYMGRSLKAQMKYADKISARFVIVLGENEFQTKCFQIKNMESGEETTSNEDELIPTLKALLNHA